MKYFSKLLIAALALVATFSACHKLDIKQEAEALPLYKAGLSPVLASSVATVAPTLADTTKDVIVFSWTNPGYATDSLTTKYVLEIDTTGSNFSNPSAKI